MQQWLSIKGFEGLYEINNEGKVKSLSRINLKGSLLKERVLKCILGSNGYYNVKLFLNGIPQTRTIHSLVAETFIGKRPDMYDVCHNNGLKTDNNVTNLRYDTRKNNLLDRISHKTINIGERNGIAKLTDKEVFIIKNNPDKSLQSLLSLKFNVHQSTISKILNSNIWNHI